MAQRESRPTGWIVQRMEALERESRTWPQWKRAELEDLLQQNDVPPPERIAADADE